MRFIHDDKIGLSAQKKNEFWIGRDTTIIDPLTLYIPNIKVPGDGTSLIGDKSKLSVAYVDSSGKIIPPTAKFVWPVACRWRLSVFFTLEEFEINAKQQFY
jgi:hypothetical protein